MVVLQRHLFFLIRGIITQNHVLETLYDITANNTLKVSIAANNGTRRLWMVRSLDERLN